MKIISKHKDYYDFLTSKYGIDELRVLDRTKYYKTPFLFKNTEPIIHRIYICDTIIEVLEINGERICGDKLLKFGEPSIWKGKEYVRIGDKRLLVSLKPLEDTDKFNTKFDCPILMDTGWNLGDFKVDDENKYRKNFAKFPILKDYNIGSIYDPDTIWCMLVDWLSKEKAVESKLTDKQKIVSHGFDKVASFRRM